MSLTYKYGASILSADFASLGKEVRRLNASSIDYIHLDVMDGHFVPNISLGPQMIEALRGYSTKVFDVHLMIQEPSRYVEMFAEAGADIITVHREVDVFDKAPLIQTLERIRTLGKKPSLACNPHTSLTNIEAYFPYIDQLLLMSVVPGFGGQKFLPITLGRARHVRELIEKSPYKIDLEVDGGVDIEHTKKIKQAGANVLIAGHCLYASKNFEDALLGLRRA